LPANGGCYIDIIDPVMLSIASGGVRHRRLFFWIHLLTAITRLPQLVVAYAACLAGVSAAASPGSKFVLAAWPARRAAAIAPPTIA
jgi:hypothetical protein